MAEVADGGIGRLRAAHDDGELETVRICFPDHYGVLRGRRIVAERFLADPHARQAFCDGALVWDIRCDIFEEVNFSNYRTGYPDLYAHPDLSVVRPCGWSEREYVLMSDCCDAHGNVLEVDPRQALRRAVQKFGDCEVATSFDLRLDGDVDAAAGGAGRPGEFSDHLSRSLAESEVGFSGTTWDRSRRILNVDLGGDAPIAAADTTVIARSAARELALTDGVDVTCMPRTEADQDPAALRITTHLGDADFNAFRRLLADIDLFLRPLPIAHGGALPLRVGQRGEKVTVYASSDANPYLAIAAVLIALGQAREGKSSGDEVSWGYDQAIARFATSEWIGEWVDSLLAHDALELAKRELVLRSQQVSDWDLRRYRECG